MKSIKSVLSIVSLLSLIACGDGVYSEPVDVSTIEPISKPVLVVETPIIVIKTPDDVYPLPELKQAIE